MTIFLVWTHPDGRRIEEGYHQQPHADEVARVRIAAGFAGVSMYRL